MTLQLSNEVEAAATVTLPFLWLPYFSMPSTYSDVAVLQLGWDACWLSCWAELMFFWMPKRFGINFF